MSWLVLIDHPLSDGLLLLSQELQLTACSPVAALTRDTLTYSLDSLIASSSLALSQWLPGPLPHLIILLPILAWTDSQFSHPTSYRSQAFPLCILDSLGEIPNKKYLYTPCLVGTSFRGVYPSHNQQLKSIALSRSHPEE